MEDFLPRETKQARSAQTRTQILDIALDMFSKRGFDGVPLRDVADAAGVTHTMIRYYFGNKDALWREAVMHLFRQLTPEIDKFGNETVPADRGWAEGVLRVYLRYWATHPDHARILVSDIVSNPERLDWACETVLKPYHAHMAKVVGRFADVGHFPRIDPRFLIYMLAGLAQQPFLRTDEIARVHGLDMTDPETIERYIDSVVTLVFRD